MDNSPFWRKKQPRLLSIDAKGSYSHERKHKENLMEKYELNMPKKTELEELWGGNVMVYDQFKIDTKPNKNEIIDPSKYDVLQDVEDQISLWSHYIDYQFTPKNYYMLRNAKFEIGDFDDYHLGSDLLRDPQENNDLFESVRYWQEDSDRMELIQIFSDIDNSYR